MLVLMSVPHLLVVSSPLSRNSLALSSFLCTKVVEWLVTLFMLVDLPDGC